MSNTSIWFIDKTLSGTTTPDLGRPRINANDEVLHDPQSSRTGTSPFDGLMSYLGHSLKESYLSAEMQSVYSAAPAD